MKPGGFKSNGLSSFASKKRGRDEISGNVSDNEYLPTTDESHKERVKESTDLWTKKYTPFNLETHCINKKKKEEFVAHCTNDPKLKVLVI